MDLYVQKDGQQLGPFPENRIRQGIDAGEFVPSDLAWTTGKASWQPLSSLIYLDMDQPPPLAGVGDLERSQPALINPDFDHLSNGIGTNIIYASFWIRVGALLVDTAVMLIPTLIVSYLFQATNSANTPAEEGTRSSFGSLINLMIWLIYCAGLESSAWQGTVGKKVCNLKVVDVNGNRISFGRAFARNVGMMISFFILCIGFVTMGFTRRRQGIHDLLTKTCVIKTSSVS